jgi:hypothetical protein
MIVYISCREKTRFPIWKTNLSLFQVKCTPETNSIDCNEAVPMLNFLIDHYDDPLARKYIFLHGHERSWHYFRPVFDQVHNVIGLDYFRKNEYGAMFPVYITGPGSVMSESMYTSIYANTTMPARPIIKDNFYPCCATFFIDSRLVRTRPKFEYELVRARLRQWSRDHPIYNRRVASVYCGRVMEYTWHILLANRSAIPAMPFPHHLVMK